MTFAMTPPCHAMCSLPHYHTHPPPPPIRVGPARRWSRRWSAVALQRPGWRPAPALASSCGMTTSPGTSSPRWGWCVRGLLCTYICAGGQGWGAIHPLAAWPAYFPTCPYPCLHVWPSLEPSLNLSLCPPFSWGAYSRWPGAPPAPPPGGRTPWWRYRPW